MSTYTERLMEEKWKAELDPDPESGIYRESGGKWKVVCTFDSPPLLEEARAIECIPQMIDILKCVVRGHAPHSKAVRILEYIDYEGEEL